jgi:chemotaxis protein histidine kinase CheA
MRERMEMVGGTFAVDSVAGQGTTVSVEVPLRFLPTLAGITTAPTVTVSRSATARVSITSVTG